MKNLLKTAVLIVVSLLAAQPVLSSWSCAAGMAPLCAQGCPMAMAGMGQECPMTGMSAANECIQDCCARNAVNAVLPKAATVKLRAGHDSWLSVLAGAAEIGPVDVQRSEIDGGRRADSPPVYLVNRVFRI